MQAVKQMPIQQIESRLDFANQTSKMPLSAVFNDRYGSYLNELTLFIAYYNYIPNYIVEKNIDCRKAHKWFTQQFQPDIKDSFYDKRYFYNSKHPELDDSFYFLYEDLLVNFDVGQSAVRFLFRHTQIEKVQSIMDVIHKMKNRRLNPKSEISLIIEGHNGLDIQAMSITKPKLKIEDNYNNDFIEIHQTIYKRLSKKNGKGLVLLHGKPGTGKTSYIRYLISISRAHVQEQYKRFSIVSNKC